MDHTAFQALITNLIPHFAFKSLIFYSSIFKTNYPEIAIYVLFCNPAPDESLAFCLRICLQLFRKRLSEKVHATFPKGIMGGFEFTVFRGNLKEWQERPWTYVYEC